MGTKSIDWRPGPTVCRCCLAEGCYKDISTEYFWMGKREVYSEMLTETFDINISYSTSGPNSNSRLICEPCISRLRDACEFKRQVHECEKTFMQYLDPGASSTMLDTQVTVEVMDSEVKLEQVKQEKAHSDDDDDDDFAGPNYPDDDEDDDDLDDQPLTKFATRIPKKESVDILDLLDNAKAAEKRKSTTKSKAPPPKKTKVNLKDIQIKPTASKAKSSSTQGKVLKITPAKPPIQVKPVAKVVKKKKGQKREDLEIKQEEEYYEIPTAVSSKDNGIERREAFRNNISTIMSSCTAYPFKYRKGTYLCFFCKSSFIEPEKLREHTRTHADLKQMLKPRKYEPLKMDFMMASCKLCGIPITDYITLKQHLFEHGKHLDSKHGESVLPYKLNKDVHQCQICGKRYEMFLSLHKHMNEHFDHYICETCGKGFATSQRMMNHARIHERGSFPCKRCPELFPSHASLYTHVTKVHKSNKRYKCPICDEKFASYKHRLKHLNTVHGEKSAEFYCPLCPKVFDLSSRRTAHIRFQHLQERNHVCSVCGMKFFTNYELREHSIKHGGERIYQCDVCKKSYARLKTLREHMRIHNNDRRFICQICGQTFIQNCSLKQHTRVHHPTHLKSDVF